MSAEPKPRLILAIATTGRDRILAETVSTFAEQTRRPDLLLLSVAGPEDHHSLDLAACPYPTQVLTGPKGLTNQRNRVLEALEPGDIVLFLDDDFLMAPDFLAETERLFAAHPDLVMVTGNVLADGIGGAGYDHVQGARLLADKLTRTPRSDRLEPVYNGYGCNMAFRADPVLAHDLRFDEVLPFYCWLEDVDFSRLLAPHGQICRAMSLRGVHLGTKTGRQKGLRLGYSQIANPVYLIRKGTMKPSRALRLMRRNFAANLVKSLKPEPWIDRSGRLRGNLLALGDLLRGRADPGRIREL